MREEKVFDTKIQDNITIWIGQNAKDNWAIIDDANDYDIWFHLEDYPSSHIILRIPDKDTIINKQTLFHCAVLCKKNSKYSDQKNISVIYTEIRNIVKGIDIGSVTTKKTKKMKI
jgi:predicted ribosome quality control (RQC) complex YloA/Tae2 family protein